MVLIIMSIVIKFVINTTFSLSSSPFPSLSVVIQSVVCLESVRPRQNRNLCPLAHYSSCSWSHSLSPPPPPPPSSPVPTPSSPRENNIIIITILFHRICIFSTFIDIEKVNWQLSSQANVQIDAIEWHCQSGPGANLKSPHHSAGKATFCLFSTSMYITQWRETFLCLEKCWCIIASR